MFLSPQSRTRNTYIGLYFYRKRDLKVLHFSPFFYSEDLDLAWVFPKRFETFSPSKKWSRSTLTLTIIFLSTGLEVNHHEVFE